MTSRRILTVPNLISFARLLGVPLQGGLLELAGEQVDHAPRGRAAVGQPAPVAAANRELAAPDRVPRVDRAQLQLAG